MSQMLSSQVLRSLLALTEKRSSLEAEVTKIEAQIRATLTGKPAKATISRASNLDKKAAPKGRKGGVKELILGSLKTAGTAGIAVKDLATSLGLKPQNVHVWFHTTGKKHAERIGTGVYRLKQPRSTAVETNAEATPKAKIARKKTKVSKAARKSKAE